MWFVHSQIGRRGALATSGLVDIVGIIAPLSIFIGLAIAAFGFFRAGGE